MKFHCRLNERLLTIECEVNASIEVQTIRGGFVITNNPITKWAFYIDNSLVSWGNLGVEDRLAIVREFMQRWYLVKGDITPWGDDIETLVALERM